MRGILGPFSSAFILIHEGNTRSFLLYFHITLHRTVIALDLWALSWLTHTDSVRSGWWCLITKDKYQTHFAMITPPPPPPSFSLKKLFVTASNFARLHTQQLFTFDDPKRPKIPPRFLDFPEMVVDLTVLEGAKVLAVLFWFSMLPPETLRSSNGTSWGMGKPDLCRSITSLESWKEGRHDEKVYHMTHVF